MHPEEIFGEITEYLEDKKCIIEALKMNTFKLKTLINSLYADNSYYGEEQEENDEAQEEQQMDK